MKAREMRNLILNQVSSKMYMIEFDELMIKEDSETNANENGNQAPSPSSSLPLSRITYPRR